MRRIASGIALSALTVTLVGACASAAPAADGLIAYSNGSSIFTVAATAAATPTRIGAGWDPAWSPDGTRIAYVSGRGLWVARPSGAGARRIAKGYAASPTWSPRGTQLAYVRSDGIAIGAPSGRKPRRFFRLSALVNDFVGAPGIAALHWSPDGRWLAFLATGDGAMTQSLDLDVVAPRIGARRRILRKGMSGGIVGSRTTRFLIGGRVAWSPDSRTVTVDGGDFDPSPDPISWAPPVQLRPLYTMLIGLHGSAGVVQPAADFTSAAWAPSGERLCGQSGQTLATYEPATAHLTTIAPIGNPPYTYGAISCDWQTAPR